MENNGLNVLSLFDGMSCGQIALERAGIKVSNYFASEIDKHAISVTLNNYPKTMQIGDVRGVSFKDGVLTTGVGAFEIGKIDLLIAGSPCQGFSMAGKQLNFDDERSALFFEYIRLLKEINPKYFLLENVKMKKEYEDVITGYLGVKPIKINSNLLSAQDRERLYWTNINFNLNIKDMEIYIDDILEENVNMKYILKETRLDYSNYDKSKVDKNLHKSTPIQIGNSRNFGNSVRSNGKAYTLRKVNPNGILTKDYKIRYYTPVECERLQTLPDNYTNFKGISDKDRYEMLGNGWTVDVVAHIFKGIKEE